MAAPTLQAEAAAVTAVTTGACAPTIPTHQTDDILWATVMVWVPNTAGTIFDIPTPANWTKAGSVDLNGATKDGQIAWFWRRAPSAGQTVSFARGTVAPGTTAWDTGTDGVYLARVDVIRGCATSGDPYDAFAASAEYTTTNQNSAAVTVSGVDRLVMQFEAYTSDTATAQFTALTGFTMGTQRGSVTGTGGGARNARLVTSSSHSATATTHIITTAGRRYAFGGVSFKPPDPLTHSVDDDIAGTDASVKAVGSLKAEAPTITDGTSRVWAAKQAPADAIQGTDNLARLWAAERRFGPRGRLFDGTDDVVTVSPGACTNMGTGVSTWAMLVRPDPANGTGVLVGNFAGASGAGYVYLSGGTPALVTSGAIAAPTITLPFNEWSIFVAVKLTSGASNVRFSRYNRGAWTHETSAGTLNDNGINATAVMFGKLATLAIHYTGAHALAAEWDNVALSQAQVEELSANHQTADWLNNSGGAPAGAWEFNQAAAGAVTDLTGNGADQSSVVGTATYETDDLDWGFAADSLGGTDAQAKAVGTPQADAIQGTDGFDRIWAPIRTQDDAVAGTDAQAKAVGTAQADAIGGTDFMATVLALVRALEDAAQGTDASFRSPGKAQDDAIQGGDGQATVWSAQRVIDDAFQGTDALSAAVATALADSVGAVDGFATSWAAAHAVSDALAASDLETHSWTAQRAIDDTAAGTDGQSIVWDAIRTITDAIQGTDGQDFTFAGLLTKSLGDEIGATDAVQKSVVALVTDLIAGTDASVRASGKALTDAIQGTDAQGKATAVSVVDNIVAMDAMARQWDAIIAIADALHGTDGTSTEFSAGGNHLTLTINDSIGAGDALGPAWDAHLAIADELTSSDTFARSVQALRSIQDAIGIVDEIDFPFQWPFTPWRATSPDARPDAAEDATIQGPENTAVTGPDNTDVTPL